MKKNNLRILVLLSICTIAGASIYAQSSDDALNLRVFGIGLHAEQYKVSNVISSNYYSAYTTTILFPLNLTQHFRLEPEMGVLWMKNKGQDYNGDDEEDTSLGFASGLGLFGMFQKGKVNFYAGLRNRLDIGKMEGMSTYNGEPVIDKYTAIKVGPALGFEYFLIDNFSIGGEFGLPVTFSKTKTEYPDIAQRENEESTNQMFNFDSGLFVRAYF
jgi:hypothetical protein